MKFSPYVLAPICLASASITPDDASSDDILPREPRDAAGHLGRANATPVSIPMSAWIKGSKCNKVDLQWYATISVGTPPQQFNVIIDSGSTGLLLMRSNCTTCGTAKSLLDTSQSSTFRNEPGLSFTPAYGTGGDTVPLATPEEASCTVVTDKVSIGDSLSSPEQQFLLCDSVGSAMRTQPVDGILGLGPFPIVSWDAENSYEPAYWHFVNTGQLPAPEYGLYIRPEKKDGHELTLGGVDETKFEGEIKTLQLNAEVSGFVETWVSNVAAAWIGGHNDPDSKPWRNSTATGDVPLPAGFAMLDSGTSFMLAPNFETTQALYADISPEIEPIDELGSWGAPCDVIHRVATDVTFTLGMGSEEDQSGLMNVTVSKRSFNAGEYPGKPGICQAIFVNQVNPDTSATGGAPTWILGGPLFKEYYTVWNGRDMTIGWAEPKHAAA